MRTIKFKGGIYTEHTATAPAVINDAYWRTSALRFWIYAVCESRTGTDLPAKARPLRAKTLNKLPPQVRDAVRNDADTQKRIFDAIERGNCQYISIEGAGWQPGVRRGDKGVEKAQRTLEWIEQFRTKNIVSGSKLIWAEITSHTGTRSRG